MLNLFGVKGCLEVVRDNVSECQALRQVTKLHALRILSKITDMTLIGFIGSELQVDQ